VGASADDGHFGVSEVSTPGAPLQQPGD
jgi:hypothetical protein